LVWKNLILLKWSMRELAFLNWGITRFIFITDCKVNTNIYTWKFRSWLYMCCVRVYWRCQILVGGKCPTCYSLSLLWKYKPCFIKISFIKTIFKSPRNKNSSYILIHIFHSIHYGSRASGKILKLLVQFSLKMLLVLCI